MLLCDAGTCVWATQTEGVGRHEFSIPIARTMKLQEIQEAHRIFERGGLSGKIVLVP